jgi:predicted DNA-binding protein
MAKSISVNRKKKRGRGRPATGRDPVIALRLPKETIAALDRWASGEGLTRSAAARQLIERGLEK